MALLNRPWQLHDVADVESLLRAALNACEFSAGLRPHEADDCIAYLFEVAWESAEGFIPGIGRVSFSTLLHRRARARAVDWFRAERGRTKWRFSNGRTYERQLPALVSLDDASAELESALAAIGGDPAADCDPDLERLLDQGGSTRTWDLYALGLDPLQSTAA